MTRTAPMSAASPITRSVAGLALALVAALSLAFTAQPETETDMTPATPQAEADFAYVVLETTAGDIYLELNRAKAPISVKNFLAYVEKDHYDGTVFHRVIPNFMIQGGGFDTAGYQRSTDSPIRNEADNGLENDRGTIAMARTNIPDSATSQFFINVKDNDFLNRGVRNPDDAGYAVFGKVVRGMDVVDQIKAVETSVKRTPNGGMRDWPVEDVVIKQARPLTPDEIAKLKDAINPEMKNAPDGAQGEPEPAGTTDETDG